MPQKLSQQKYWDNVHKDRSIAIKSILNFPIIRDIAIGFHNWDLYRICERYFKKDHKNIFEIGCAPGNYLVQFHKRFWFNVGGVEYSKDGINILKRNFKKNNIEGNIVYGDFFDKKFLTENKDKHDIVFSLGFIEHFSDPRIAIENHFKIAKKWGLVIMTIPNLYYLNRFLTNKEILKIHNLNIMKLEELKKQIKKENILYLNYFWWLFNFWAFSYKNVIIENIRFGLFILQRLFIDPIFMIIRLLGINFSNKYTSPSIIIICKKD